MKGRYRGAIYIRTAEREGLIEKTPKKSGNSVLWKLTPKGRRKAKSGALGAPAHVPKSAADARAQACRR